MPPLRQLIIRYRLAVARNPKTEPEFFPSLFAIHSAGGLAAGDGPGMAECGFALGMEAMRNLDPETAHYVVHQIGDHKILSTADHLHGRVPILEKHGWKIYIDWD